MSVKEWRERFRQYHPAIKTIFYMAPVSLTVFIHNWLWDQPPDTRNILSNYYETALENPWTIFNFVVVMPVYEELLFRGPVWLILLLTLALPVKYKIAGYITYWTLLLGLCLIWANGHHYPITVFGYGMLWGWLMFAMRARWYAIVFPVLFHSASNAVAFLSIIFGYHLIY